MSDCVKNAVKRAKEKVLADDSDGAWKTIQGRKVFIKKGQSVEDAMSSSGKFGKSKVDAGLDKARTDAAKIDKIKKEDKPRYKDLLQNRKEAYKDGRDWVAKNQSKYSGKPEQALVKDLLTSINKKAKIKFDVSDVSDMTYDAIDDKGKVK